MMVLQLLGRLRRRVGRELESLACGVRFARTASGPTAALGMLAAGMVQASPGRWCGRLLTVMGLRRVSLRPRRLAGDRVLVDLLDGGHTCVVEEFFVSPICCDFILVGFAPQYVIDCGAHIGIFTLLARRQYPEARLTAFEPNPTNHLALHENLRRNGVDGVTVVPAAVSVSSGRLGFQFSAFQSEGGRLAADDAVRQDASTVTMVEVVDLPEFVRNLGATSLLLKLDVEGEEERLMPELLPVLPPQCAIFFETHRGQESWEAIDDQLRGAGFTVDLLRERGPFRDGVAVRGSPSAHGSEQSRIQKTSQ